MDIKNASLSMRTSDKSSSRSSLLQSSGDKRESKLQTTQRNNHNATVGIANPKEAGVADNYLKRLREQRIDAIRKQRKESDLPGPRLAPDTIAVDQKSFAALQRERGKEYAQSLRESVKSSQKVQSTSTTVSGKEKRKSLSEFNLSNFRLPSDDAASKVNSAFEDMLNLGGDDLLCDSLENPTALLFMMPEREREEKKVLEQDQLSSVLSYNLPKPKLESASKDLPPLLPALITNQDKIDMERKHDKLLSKIKIPSYLSQATLVPARKPKSSKSGN